MTTILHMFASCCPCVSCCPGEEIHVYDPDNTEDDLVFKGGDIERVKKEEIFGDEQDNEKDTAV